MENQRKKSMEKDKIRRLIEKYYESGTSSNARIESLRMAKDIVFPSDTPLTDKQYEDCDKLLDRMFYIAFRIEEQINK